MAQTKKMDESAFAKIVKEFNAVGELIRARQDEKQAIIDQFRSESKRFFFGKISERTLASSVGKTNKELQKLDGEIRTQIAKAGDLANQARKFISAQSPKTFRAKISGVSRTGTRKKVSRRRKVVRRKPARRKPVAKKKVVKRKVVRRKPARRKPVAKKKKAAKKRKK